MYLVTYFTCITNFILHHKFHRRWTCTHMSTRKKIAFTFWPIQYRLQSKHFESALSPKILFHATVWLSAAGLVKRGSIEFPLDQRRIELHSIPYLLRRQRAEWNTGREACKSTSRERCNYFVQSRENDDSARITRSEKLNAFSTLDNWNRAKLLV